MSKTGYATILARRTKAVAAGQCIDCLDPHEHVSQKTGRRALRCPACAKAIERKRMLA